MEKKVTFIIGHMAIGGAERVISVIANDFVKRGIEVNIIALVSDEIGYCLDSRINYCYISSSSRFRAVRIVSKCIQLRRKIKKMKKTKIISFLYGPILYTIFSTIFLDNEICISERNNPYMEPTSALARKIRNVSYYFADKIVFQTDEAKNYFSYKIQKKGCVIPNPVKDDLPERFNGKRKKEIIAACRLDPQKNLKMLINAYKMLENKYPEYNLIIYGEGPLRRELESYTKELELSNKIKFPGFSNDIHEKMLSCTMYVSSSNYEGISNSMLEALAMGVPSVVTDCPIGGAKMVIENNVNGILVPVGDVDKFYFGMKTIIENEKLANIISQNALKVKKRFSSKQVCERWLDVIW